MKRPFRGLEDEEPYAGENTREIDESAELDALQKDLQRRQYHPRAPRRISQVINQLARKRGYFQTLTDDRWEEAWQAVLAERPQGKRLAPATRVGRLRRGVLEIFVRNSMALQELTFDKSNLLKHLQAHVPEAKLRDLKFRVGDVT